MLEALIRTKHSASSDKRRGDVICVKLQEFADWGSMEIRAHQPILWLDDDLEFEMRQELEKTGIAPISITPYKEEVLVEFIGESGLLIAEKNITTTRSRKYFDIDSIEDINLRNMIIGDGVAVELGDVSELIKTKTQEQVDEEFEFNKNNEREIIQRKLRNSDIDETQEIIKVLTKIQQELKEDGVSIDLIDGKFVEVEE